MQADERNLWRDTSRAAMDASALAGAVTTDVAIVGGGIMGAAAALTLSEAGVTVVMVEAARLGEGASSRAGGFVVPHFTFGSPRQVIDHLGERGERLVQAVGGSAARVYELIERHGIACDARQGGWYQPAHNAAALRNIEATATAWAKLGFPVELLDAEHTTARTGVAGYRGSWCTREGGTLHPLDYTLGLISAAVRAGARAFANSKITRIAKQGGKFILHGEHGTVTAEQVLICTNALSGGLTPELERGIVRMRIWQCATDPIAAPHRQHLFKNGESLSDTRANLFTYRFDRDWRLITGALSAWGQSDGQTADAMARRLQQMLNLPQLPEISYLWQGVAAVTPSRLPAIVEMGEGLLSATACNGRGIALSTIAGEALARAVLRRDLAELPFPIVRKLSPLSARVQQSLACFYPYYARLADWWADSRK